MSVTQTNGPFTMQPAHRRPPVSAEEREIHVAGCDGTDLHATIHEPPGGVPADRPVLIFSNGIGVSTFFWKYIVGNFRGRHRCITWDYRGHGKSEAPRDPKRISMADNADDLERVLVASGSERAVLIGHSMGSQVILEHWRRYPKRDAALVPFLGTYGHPVDTFADSAYSRYVFEACYAAATRWPALSKRVWMLAMNGTLAWPFARLVGLVHDELCKRDDLTPYLEHMGQLDVAFFMMMAKEMQEHTTEEILGSITIPVLVLAGERDLFTPKWLSEKMHTMIRTSELMVIPMGSHVAMIEQPELVNLRLEKFLRDHDLW